MKRLLSEPLIHFLVVGGLLLAFVSVFRGNDGDEKEETEASGRRIRVEADALEQFIQAKTGIEDPAAFSASYATLDDSARREWIDRFVREEALVREARRLGLDQQDDLIRRRLVQQIEFVALGVVESTLEFGPEQLEETYRARREDYRVPATSSFSHVFVRFGEGGEMGDEKAARQRAEGLLDRLNAEKIDAASALGKGDRFLYNRNYVDRTEDEVISHFGEGMASALGKLEVDAGQWKGPFRSSHGFHLVLLMHSEDSRLPEVDEIREMLREDWRREVRDTALDQAVAKIIAEYQVELADGLAPSR